MPLKARPIEPKPPREVPVLVVPPEVPVDTPPAPDGEAAKPLDAPGMVDLPPPPPKKPILGRKYHEE